MQAAQGQGRRVRISGVGHSVPEHVVTNFDLEKRMNTTDAFIVERTGVRERRHIDSERGLKDLLVPAANRAMASAGLRPDEVGLFIVNTLSPDHHDPSEACFVHPLLGLGPVPSFDIRAQCAGFLYAVQIASAFIQSAMAENALVVCGEVLSKRIDCSDQGRNLSVLLGDGAGAVVLVPSQDGTGFVDQITGADGRFFHLLWTRAPGSAAPQFISPESLERQEHQFRMNGRPMADHATRTMVDAARALLARNRLTIEDIDLVIPHQPNLRILDRVRAELGLSEEKMVITVERYGNMASASLPITLSVALETGRVTPGKLALFLGYGGGATWGAALYQF